MCIYAPVVNSREINDAKMLSQQSFGLRFVMKNQIKIFLTLQVQIFKEPRHQTAMDDCKFWKERFLYVYFFMFADSAFSRQFYFAPEIFISERAGESVLSLASVAFVSFLFCIGDFYFGRRW